jgi:hypothetical protein
MLIKRDSKRCDFVRRVRIALIEHDKAGQLKLRGCQQLLPPSHIIPLCVDVYGSRTK